MKRKKYIPILAFIAMLGIAMIPSGVATISSCSKDNNFVENDLRMGWRLDYPQRLPAFRTH